MRFPSQAYSGILLAECHWDNFGNGIKAISFGYVFTGCSELYISSQFMKGFLNYRKRFINCFEKGEAANIGPCKCIGHRTPIDFNESAALGA